MDIDEAQEDPVRLVRRCGELLVLGGETSPGRASGRSEAKTVPLTQIIGTLARCCDFDACFRPLRRHLRARLDRLRRQLPHAGRPVVLHETPAGYYVEDGHHRIALAWERGQVAVDAHVRSRLSEDPAAHRMREAAA